MSAVELVQRAVRNDHVPTCIIKHTVTQHARAPRGLLNAPATIAPATIAHSSSRNTARIRDASIHTQHLQWLVDEQNSALRPNHSTGAPKQSLAGLTQSLGVNPLVLQRSLSFSGCARFVVAQVRFSANRLFLGSFLTFRSVSMGHIHGVEHR